MRTGRDDLGADASRVNILGVGVSPLDLGRAVSSVHSMISGGTRGYICVTDIHAIMEAHADAAFRDIQNNSLLTTPDGMPTVWIGRLNGHHDMSQVRGTDFMLAFCESSVRTKTRHFLYGGRPGVAELLRDMLTIRFPGIRIVGTYTPPFRPLTPSEETELQHTLEELNVDIFWCGIGCPKQERFMARYIHRFPVRLMVGVGAAFDLNAGLINDSPSWVRTCGLQWAHRLCQEPQRLWKRYLFNIPRFLWLYLLQWTGIHSYTLPQHSQGGSNIGVAGGISPGEAPGQSGDIAA